ncbi:MAG: MIP/aquaporin family protein [Balneolaceae bacterium]
MIKKYAAEFIGTFFLVLSVGLTSNPLAIGILLTALVYVWENYSGAHFNPAITLSFWSDGIMSSREALVFVAGQLMGAFAGAELILYLSGTAYMPTPSDTITPLQFAVIQFLFTFLLVMVYLMLYNTERFRNNNIHGIAIGFTYFAIIAIAAPLTGIGFNPSLSIGFSVFEILLGGDSYLHLPVYVFSPLIAGWAATYVFRFFEPFE